MGIISKLEKSLNDFCLQHTSKALDKKQLLLYLNMYYKASAFDFLDKHSEELQEEIEDILNYAMLETYYKITKSLALRDINENICKINAIVSTINITQDTIIKDNIDIVEAVDISQLLLFHLTHQNYPMMCFEDFLATTEVTFDIARKDCKRKFKYSIPKEERNYGIVFRNCDTVQEFLADCSRFMMDTICKKIKSEISSPNYFTVATNDSIIDKSIKHLTGKELYTYLFNKEEIRLYYDLSKLYLLCFYDDIEEFKDTTMMQSLANCITINKKHKINKYNGIGHCSKKEINT